MLAGKEGTIYFGAKEGFFALNPDGTKKWHYQKEISGIVSSPAIGSDGTIYVGTWQNKLYAFGEGEIEDDISEKTDELEYENKTYQWHPKDEGIDCFQSQPPEIKEKCDMFCYDNPDFCPDYFERKHEFQKPGFFEIVIDWFRSFFKKV